MPAKKTASKSKAKSGSAKQAAAPAAAPDAPAVQESAAAPAAAPAPATETDSWTELESQFTSITNRLQEFKALQASLTADVRRLQKNVQRYLKESAKKNKRRKKPAPGAAKRAPSGFAKPAVISKELCTFLGKPKGTEMARTEVTKYLTNYIKEHNLQDAENKRRILPDKKLSSLLNVPKDDTLTYFNLQKYMKVHFPKPASAATTSSA